MASGTDGVIVTTKTAGWVVVTGAASELGQRVCELAAADPDVPHVVALDRKAMKKLWGI